MSVFSNRILIKHLAIEGDTLEKMIDRMLIIHLVICRIYHLRDVTKRELGERLRTMLDHGKDFRSETHFEHVIETLLKDEILEALKQGHVEEICACMNGQIWTVDGSKSAITLFKKGFVERSSVEAFFRLHQENLPWKE